MLDSIVTCIVPCKQLLSDCQRDVWFVDSSSEVNTQTPVWKDTVLRPAERKVLIEEGKNRLAHFSCTAYYFPSSDERIEQW